MKALVLEKYNLLEYKDVPDPVVGQDEVLVRVKACGICGSDVHGMDGSTGRRIPPVIMGHEASGVIEEVGKHVKGWYVGDRVTFDSTIYPLNDWYTLKGLYNLSDDRKVLGVSCKDYRRDGAFAEYVSIPHHILYKLPDNVSFNHAALVEPAAVAFHAVDLTPISLGDTAVVIGTGIIGLFLVQALRIKGCGFVVAVDIDENRLQVAKKLGADLILKADQNFWAKEVLAVTENRGADITFEAVGIAETIKIGIESLRKGGTLTLVGNISPNVEIPLQSIVTKQIRLQGSCAICGEFPSVLQMMANERLKVKPLISATAPLSEGATWFKRLYQKEKGLLKVILNP